MKIELMIPKGAAVDLNGLAVEIHSDLVFAFEVPASEGERHLFKGEKLADMQAEETLKAKGLAGLAVPVPSKKVATKKPVAKKPPARKAPAKKRKK